MGDLINQYVINHPDPRGASITIMVLVIYIVVRVTRRIRRIVIELGDAPSEA